MSKSIPISRKLTDFHNNENSKISTNYQIKKIINNHKYNKHYSKEPPLQLNSKINNHLLEKYFNENNYANNLFNETENNNNLINRQINNPEYITINEIIGEKCEINLDILRLFFNNFDQSKTSRKNMGVIKSYGVNTYQGIVRNYNEDRVSIIINMNKPKNFTKTKWPKISFFGIYDGHGGEGCSEYLRDNLHKLICSNENFPEDIPKAIKLGILNAEQDFLNNFALSENKEEIIDKSGSCAIILLIVDTNAYIANVGDSRALLSMNNGNKYLEVTKDHKPNSPNEIIRIKKNGGNIYQSQTLINNTDNMDLNGKILIGPYRVLPGRLSVSRTIGDAEAKLVKFGGNPNVITCEPEIFYYNLKEENIDFFILGCDGIYDQMSNKEVLDCAWMVLNEKDNILIKECKNIHNQSGLIVDLILKSSLARKSFDNVTCLFISLKDLGIKPNEKNEKIENLHSDNGITPQKNFPLNKNDQSQSIGIGVLSNQNKKSNFEKIYTIKRKSNLIPKQVVNDFDKNNYNHNHNNENEETKCRTNRNENRFQLLDENNRFTNNNNDKIFNTDYKINTLKLNSNNNSENKNKQNLSVKDISVGKKEKGNYRKIQTKQNNNKESNENTINRASHSKYQSSNLMAYSKKNQSFTKINKYLISLNNNNNSINNNYKQIKKNNINNYNEYTIKKISEGNIINKKNTEINANNRNNNHIFKPMSKYSLNSQQPLKAIETKNTFTSSTKNLNLGNKSSIILNNINNKNGNQFANNGSTKSHRYIITNKEKRNSSYLSFNNNNFNNNIINDKLKKNFVNLNEQYKYQSQLMNNSINNNLSSFSNQNINNINERKPKKHLSLNNPGNNNILSSNNFIVNRNINNVFSSRLKKDITSKIRQISMQKYLPNNNFRIINQTNESSKHNLSMQNIQLSNKIDNFNYNYNMDKIKKMKTYKFSNNDNNYQNSTFNSKTKNSNYDFGKYNSNNTSINSNNYLMTDLGRTNKEFLFDNKKNNFLIQ